MLKRNMKEEHDVFSLKFARRGNFVNDFNSNYFFLATKETQSYTPNANANLNPSVGTIPSRSNIYILHSTPFPPNDEAVASPHPYLPCFYYL